MILCVEVKKSQCAWRQSFSGNGWISSRHWFGKCGVKFLSEFRSIRTCRRRSSHLGGGDVMVEESSTEKQHMKESFTAASTIAAVPVILLITGFIRMTDTLYRKLLKSWRLSEIECAQVKKKLEDERISVPGGGEHCRKYQ